MQLIAGSKSKRVALDCKYGGLREQESAQPVEKRVQGAAGDGDASVQMRSAVRTFEQAMEKRPLARRRTRPRSRA